jgi:light-regulated signal transduction histidine kinase (bacteriophytochrome)
LEKSNERLTLEIQERRRAEEALKMFAYSVAHDLKSPTIGIHGLTKRLHKLYGHVFDDKGRSYCDQILKASEHIAALVEQVNTFIVTKEATPSFEDIDIKDVLHMLKTEFSARLSIRRIELIEPSTEVRIKADKLSLLRVFRNLIDNALKYGGERLNKITIGHKDTQYFHILCVTDNGKGLKGVDSEEIFKMFHREKTARGTEGAGLGLTIVKEIVERHVGKVWVEPGTLRGTTFCLSISKDPKNHREIISGNQ